MQKELFVYIVDKRVAERKRETEKRKETLPCVEETSCRTVEWIGNDTKLNKCHSHLCSTIKAFSHHHCMCVCVIWTRPDPAQPLSRPCESRGHPKGYAVEKGTAAALRLLLTPYTVCASTSYTIQSHHM